MPTNKTIREQFEEKFEVVYEGTKLGICRNEDYPKILSFIEKALLTQLQEVEGMVGEELRIQKQVQEKAKEVVAIGRVRVAGMVADKYTRIGKIEALSDLLSALKEKKEELSS